MNVKAPEQLHNQEPTLKIQISISGFGFYVLLPHLCGMPTASISTFFHSIFKSKWAENVDFHMWRASILILVQPGLSPFLCMYLETPACFFAFVFWIRAFESLRCPINYRRNLPLFSSSSPYHTFHSFCRHGVEGLDWTGARGDPLGLEASGCKVIV